jgi:hypothetical protein
LREDQYLRESGIRAKDRGIGGKSESKIGEKGFLDEDRVRGNVGWEMRDISLRGVGN